MVVNPESFIGLFRLLFSRLFVKALIGFAILVSVASVFPWTRNFYDRVFPQPELRIVETGQPQAISVGNEPQYQKMATVENRGNTTANQVYISASLLGRRITKYEVFADQPYTVHSSTNTARGYLMLALDRLPPGARVVVYLSATPSEYGQSSKTFAAVYDAGSAPRSDEPSSREQIQGMVTTVATSFQDSFTWATAKVIGPDEIRNIRIPTIPPHLAISAIALAVLAWLFQDPAHAALTHGGLAAFLVWGLVPPIIIPWQVMLACTTPFFLLVLLRIKELDNFGHRVMLAMTCLFFVFGVLDATGNVPPIHEVTDWVTVGYIVTMLSLELL